MPLAVVRNRKRKEDVVRNGAFGAKLLHCVTGIPADCPKARPAEDDRQVLSVNAQRLHLREEDALKSEDRLGVSLAKRLERKNLLREFQRDVGRIQPVLRLPLACRRDDIPPLFY